MSHGVIGGGGDLDDSLVLHMEGKCASDPAVRADGVGLRLLLRVPCPFGPHRMFTSEHQCAGGANLDTVPAIHARRVRQGVVELRRDTNVEPASGRADGKRVLPLITTGIHALVTHDALRVVPYVQVVVIFHGLHDALGERAVRGVVMPGQRGVTDGRRCERDGPSGRRSTVAGDVDAVLLIPPIDVWRD